MMATKHVPTCSAEQHYGELAYRCVLAEGHPGPHGRLEPDPTWWTGNDLHSSDCDGCGECDETLMNVDPMEKYLERAARPDGLRAEARALRIDLLESLGRGDEAKSLPPLPAAPSPSGSEQ